MSYKMYNNLIELKIPLCAYLYIELIVDGIDKIHSFLFKNKKNRDFIYFESQAYDYYDFIFFCRVVSIRWRHQPVKLREYNFIVNFINL